MYTSTVLVFLLLPFSTGAKIIYRLGTASGPLTTIRPQDFDIHGDEIEPTSAKGMSCNEDYKGFANMHRFVENPSALKKAKIWSTDTSKVIAAGFGVIEDGGRNGNPVGHVSVTVEKKMSQSDVKSKINALGWVLYKPPAVPKPPAPKPDRKNKADKENKQPGSTGRVKRSERRLRRRELFGVLNELA